MALLKNQLGAKEREVKVWSFGEALGEIRKVVERGGFKEEVKPARHAVAWLTAEEQRKVFADATRRIFHGAIRVN